MFTTALIPKNGTWITETYSPKGFLVADYDAEGMADNRRWFASRLDAECEADMRRAVRTGKVWSEVLDKLFPAPRT